MKKISLSLGIVILTIFLSCFLFSCNKQINVEEATANIDELMNKADDAFTHLYNAFSNKRIVFIGSSNHAMVNDHDFLNRDHIKKLHEKGLRYIFVEGGGQGDFVYSEDRLKEDWIVPFYPWHRVDVQYDTNEIRKVVLDVNKELDDNEKIKIVGLETNRRNFLPNEKESVVYNYRDKYMADVAIHFLDTIKKDEKVLIYTGSAHGIKKEIKWGGTFGYQWKPLGCYLDEKYGEDYAAYSYYTLSGNFEPWFIGGINLPGEQIKQKYFSVKDAMLLQQEIPFMQDSWETLTDGFFIDKNAEYGIKYCYKMDDEKVRREVINLAKERDSYIRNLKGVYDYSNPDVYYKICEHLRCLYSIKLYYGEAFNYNFWNANNNFSKAIENLDINAPSLYSKTDEQLCEYQLYISSLMNRLPYISSKRQAEKYYIQNKTIIEKAIEIFPEDIWGYYWLSQINFKMKNYKEALKYTDLFINNKVSLCSQVFPDMLYLAVDCCKELDEDPGFYIRMLARTNNQYNVEIEYFDLINL